MKEIIKKCFDLSIYWQVTPMPAQELLCPSLASSCLPSNCLQAMADGLWSCLSPVQSISSGHQLKPLQLSRQLRGVGRAGKKGEVCNCHRNHKSITIRIL